MPDAVPIEADLEAFSSGRAAAHDGHGRLAEGERAFYTIMYELFMQQLIRDWGRARDSRAATARSGCISGPSEICA